MVLCGPSPTLVAAGLALNGSLVPTHLDRRDARPWDDDLNLIGTNVPLSGSMAVTNVVPTQVPEVGSDRTPASAVASEGVKARGARCYRAPCDSSQLEDFDK